MKRIVLQNAKYLASHNSFSTRSFSTCFINKNVNFTEGTLEKSDNQAKLKKPQVVIKPVNVDEDDMSKESYFNKSNSGLNTSEKVGAANPGIYDSGSLIKDKRENVVPKTPGASMYNVSQETGESIRRAEEDVADLNKMGKVAKENIKENVKENVKEKASNVMNDKNVKQAMNKAKEWKDEAVDKTADMTTKVRDKTIQYKEEAKDKMEDVKENMGDAMEKGKEKAATAGEVVTETVKEAASVVGQKAKEMKDKVVDKVNEWTADSINSRSNDPNREARP